MTIKNESAAVRHLAEVRGLTLLGSRSDMVGCSEYADSEGCVYYLGDCSFVPGIHWNPAKSLDHCADVEAKLTGEQWSKYVQILDDLYEQEQGRGVVGWARFLLTLPPSVRFPALCEATGYREE